MGAEADVLGPHVAREIQIDVGGLRLFLAAIEKVRAQLGTPVQALRGDRVVSNVQVRMAAEHARRSTSGGTARALDPAVEFLLYAAVDRQIHRAVASLGIRPDAAQDVVVVALGEASSEALGVALAAAGLPRGEPFVRDAPAEDVLVWWTDRLGLPKGAGPRMVEDRLLAAMALLALDRT